MTSIRAYGARVDDCTRLQGRLKAKRFKQKFVAMLSECGDGVVDGPNGVECDDGNRGAARRGR